MTPTAARKFVLNIIEVDQFPEDLPELGDREMNYAYLTYPGLSQLAKALAVKLGAEVYTEDGVFTRDTDSLTPADKRLIAELRPDLTQQECK